MESILTACITGVVTLIGVILSNSKSRAVMEVKLDALTAKVEKHNQVLERTYDIDTLKRKALGSYYDVVQKRVNELLRK